MNRRARSITARAASASLALVAGAALALVGLLALPASARADTPSRADVEAALRKPGDANLSRLATEAEVILIAIADDKAVEGPVRARAVAALAYARTARAHTYLENLVLRKAPSSDPVDRLLLRRGAVALGWQSGPRVVDIVAPLLDHVDPDVRLDAAVALGLSRAATAEAPLRARLSQESEPAVRRQIESALRAVAPSPAR